MAAITWRNIDAPENTAALQLMSGGNQLMSESLGKVGQQMVDYSKEQKAIEKEANTIGLIEEMRQGATDLAKFNDMDFTEMAAKYGSNIDKAKAMDVLLGMRPDLVSESNTQYNRDQAYNQAVQNLKNVEARQFINEEIQKVGSVDTAFTESQSIRDWKSSTNKWRATMKDVQDTWSGSGGKGWTWFDSGNFNTDLKEAQEFVQKNGGTPQMFEYIMSQLPRDDNGAIEMGQFRRVYKDVKPLYDLNKEKQATLRMLENKLQQSEIEAARALLKQTRTNYGR